MQFPIQVCQSMNKTTVLITVFVNFFGDLFAALCKSIDVIEVIVDTKGGEVDVVHSWLELSGGDFSVLMDNISYVTLVTSLDVPNHSFADVVLDNLHKAFLFDGET